MIVVEDRASYILFNVLRGTERKGKWIIPSNCCWSIPAVFYKSATPFEVLDIDEDSLCLDIRSISARIRENPDQYAGVLFIYTYGVDLDFQADIREFKKEHPSVWFIEDRCLCRPVADMSAMASDMVLFSTGYAKYTDIGIGGFAHIGSKIQYRRYPTTYQAGADSALDGKVKSAIGNRVHLSPEKFSCAWLVDSQTIPDRDDYLDKVSARTQIADRTKQELNEVYATTMSEEYCAPRMFNHWRFNVAVNKSTALLKRLFSAGLFASKHYCPLGNYLDLPVQASPTAERLYENIVNLFNDKYYSVDQARLTALTVEQHVAEHGIPDMLWHRTDAR